MTLSPGIRLGPYEITAKLGEGGMGEVYRATDTKLKRDVAIKVLPAAFTEDKERLARFEREAQLLAQLHHPNIASIFGLEESDGTKALVMELVEGPTLAERLESGALPFNESLSVSLQIAQALEEAHEKGIVHRDLKPQNIKASIEGKVKVLDFGLAKAMDPMGAASGGPGSASQLAASPTLTLGATQMGVILGTAAYMAPEQAKGMAVDKRADIWAFGVVLFEMLTGKRLFEAPTVPETLAHVLTRTPDLAELPESTPPAIRRLLRRCLERNPKSRLHDIADARIVLEEIASGRSDERDSRGSGTPAREVAPARSRWSLAAASLAAGLALGGVLAWTIARSTIEPPVPPRAARFAIYPPEGSAFQRSVAISPDGQRIAFSALRADGQSTLWVRPLEALEAYELPGTEGARLPFWAPDGRRLGFFANRGLYWTDSKGGSPIFVVETANSQEVRGGSWSADDTIVYGPSYMGPLFAVPAKGGKSVPATRITDGGAIGTNRFPSFLPDGRRFVYYAAAGAGTEPGELWLGRLGSLDGKLLGPANSMAVPAPPDFLLFARGETLVAQRFDDEREVLVGAPEILGLPMGGSLAVSGLRSIATSTDGTLLYRNDKRNASQLVLAGRDGREIDALSDATSAWNYAPHLSPDGKFLLFSRYVFPTAGLGQIWALDLNRKLASRTTFQDDADQFISLWMPPGSREFLFNSVRPGGRWSILHGSIDRPRETSVWLEGDKLIAAKAVTPDGGRVVYERDEGNGQLQLWLRDFDGTGPGTRLTAASAIESNPDVSPDGRWLAYASSATREWEVYVRPLDGGSEVRISNEGGTSPRWRRDGRELFYVDASGRLVAVPIAAPQAGGDTVVPGAPEILFLARFEEASDRQYDVLPDGQRFVLNQIVASDDVPIVVVQHWTSLLEKGVP